MSLGKHKEIKDVKSDVLPKSLPGSGSALPSSSAAKAAVSKLSDEVLVKTSDEADIVLVLKELRKRKEAKLSDVSSSSSSTDVSKLTAGLSGSNPIAELLRQFTNDDEALAFRLRLAQALSSGDDRSYGFQGQDATLKRWYVRTFVDVTPNLGIANPFAICHVPLQNANPMYNNRSTSNIKIIGCHVKWISTLVCDAVTPANAAYQLSSVRVILMRDKFPTYGSSPVIFSTDANPPGTGSGITDKYCMLSGLGGAAGNPETAQLAVRNPQVKPLYKVYYDKVHYFSVENALAVNAGADFVVPTAKLHGDEFFKMDFEQQYPDDPAVPAPYPMINDLYLAVIPDTAYAGAIIHFGFTTQIIFSDGTRL